MSFGNYYDVPGAPQAYAATAGLAAVGPGIDISHYGAPYAQMLGLDGVGMLYRYGAGLGWEGTPSEDPRMVKRFTTVRSTYRVGNLGGDRTAARAAAALLAKARSLFSGNTVRLIGTTGWTAQGTVGYEVILAGAMRAGEIKSKNFQAGQKAASMMGGGVRFFDASTTIPSNAYEDAPPDALPVPEESPSATLAEEEGGFFSQKVAGLPVWAVGIIGLTVAGGLGFLALRPKKRAPAAVAANRRRRRRSSRRRRRSSRRR